MFTSFAKTNQRVMIEGFYGGGVIPDENICNVVGFVLLVYLNNSLFIKTSKLKSEGKATTNKDIEEAIYDGAALRLRPKLMTVFVDIIGLMPVLLATGTGSDVMKPITIPFVFGLITSTLFVLIVLPVMYAMVRERELARKGKLVVLEFED